jgi:hypothetical protein
VQSPNFLSYFLCLRSKISCFFNFVQFPNFRSYFLCLRSKISCFLTFVQFPNFLSYFLCLRCNYFLFPKFWNNTYVRPITKIRDQVLYLHNSQNMSGNLYTFILSLNLFGIKQRLIEMLLQWNKKKLLFSNYITNYMEQRTTWEATNCEAAW